MPGSLSVAGDRAGHVLGATLFYGFLIYCAQVVIPGRTYRAVQAAVPLTIFLMGYARVQLAERWPTDVLGGYAIGFLVLIRLIWLHRRLGRADQDERPGLAVVAAS